MGNNDQRIQETLQWWFPGTFSVSVLRGAWPVKLGSDHHEGEVVLISDTHVRLPQVFLLQKSLQHREDKHYNVHHTNYRSKKKKPTTTQQGQTQHTQIKGEKQDMPEYHN